MDRKLKSGMVAIVGRPNVGKSTLLNCLLGEKVSIVSDVPQTTRRQIRGIYTDHRGQIVFIDTPGLHSGRDKLDKYMSRASTGSIDGTDVVIHLVDASEKTGPEERQVVGRLDACGKPIIVGLNKVDVTKGKFVPEYIKLWEDLRGMPVTEMKDMTLLPLSALKGTNVKKLVDLLFELMPAGPLLYPEDVLTDFPKRMAMADLVREKLFLLMREEVPHSIAVIIESVRPKRGKVLQIRAAILVERESQKEIVIGRGGAVLKQAGSQARRDLEELVGQKVFLELFVKTKPDWRDDYSALEEMGYVFSDLV
ncbi:MAG: GTPase Era [Candidatus Omnitrophica bacterium]|nr:GTPase Era [Candidatus Omnitrophota bacterium]MDE2214686.1 GTPase Era [Candidatus Omnitrophota bacterium]